MTPIWRFLSICFALLAGFFLPILGLIFFLGVIDLGQIAVLGLLALAAAVTLVVLVLRGRLRF